MAGAAPTAKPAPFLRPLDVLDRGLLLAESALSLVIVVTMLFAAVSESAFRMVVNWPTPARAALIAALWQFLVGMKLSGPSEATGGSEAHQGAQSAYREGAAQPASSTPAVAVWRRLTGKELPSGDAVRRCLVAFLPVALVLGFGTERLMRAIVPHASDVLMNGTIWAAFLGASYATRGRRHLAIDALSRLLPDRGRRAMVGLSATLGAFVALALGQGILHCLSETAATAADQLRQMRESGVTSSVDRSYEFQYVLPGGFALIGLRLAMHGFHEFAAALSGYVPPEAPAHGNEPGPGLDGETPAVVEDTREPAQLFRATPTEVGVAMGCLLVLFGLTFRTSVFPAMLLMGGLCALVIGVPFLLRKRASGSFDAPHPDPVVRPTASPAHFAIAAVAVLGILGVMRFALAPNLANIPTGAGVAFFIVMALMGAPLFSFLGGLGMFLFVKFFLADPNVERHAHAFSNSVEDILGNHFARMSVLATIPLFTLAGYIMSESRMPQRLVRVSRALLGWMPGGLAVVCVFASAFFTIFSGASGITIVAVGGLLVPALLKDKYPEGFSLGLVTTGGALGITVPPCLPLIVYGIVAGLQEPAPGQERLELQKFLLVGLVPGLVAIGLMVIYCIVMGAMHKVPRSRFDAKEAGAALWEAKWELALPLVLLVGLAKGIFNPSQAAAFTAFYVFVMEVFVYRDLTITKDIPRIVPESMVLVGAIFVKLCAATVLVGYFVQAQIADRLFEWLTCGPPAAAFQQSHNLATCREAVDALARNHQTAGGIIDSKITFLLALNVFLLIIGMLMDIFSAIVVVVPLIAGIALHFNINPYHLGIVFLLNLEIGYLMPPMGLNLFIAGFRFNRPVPDLYRMVLPFIGLFIAALLIVTYIPALTLFTLPNGGRPPVVATPAPGTDTTPAGGAGATPGGEDPGGAGGDCDVPREDEDMAAFQRRCAAGAAGGGAAAGPGPDCDVPREGEDFPAFQARCNTEPAAPAADADAAPASTDAAAPAGDAPAAAAPAAAAPTAPAAAAPAAPANP